MTDSDLQSRDLQLHQVPVLPTILWQGQTNACGPHMLAMAATALLGTAVSPEEAAHRLRFFRVPSLGATLPWGIVFVARGLGLFAEGHWLGRVEDLKRLVGRGRLAAVLVRPDDWPGCPRFALHYRLVVGYRDDASLPGGGELYFACSGSPVKGLSDGRPGNVAVSYARFRAQWHTYLTPRWHAELSR